MGSGERRGWCSILGPNQGMFSEVCGVQMVIPGDVQQVEVWVQTQEIILSFTLYIFSF